MTHLERFYDENVGKQHILYRFSLGELYDDNSALNSYSSRGRRFVLPFSLTHSFSVRVPYSSYWKVVLTQPWLDVRAVPSFARQKEELR